jgi:undecaprenol kinase
MLLRFLMDRKPSFKHALDGIVYVVASQKNAWIHLFATVLVVLIGIVLRISVFSWIPLVFAIGLVWSMEILNTAIEAMVDLLSPQYHPSAKIAKDAGAAAVLMAAISALIIGLLVFIPPILNLFKR